MAAVIRLKSIRAIVANTRTIENVLSFREEHVHNLTPQFVPNVFQGVDVLEKAKFRRLVITFDSDSNIFGTDGTELNWFVAQANAVIGTTIVASFWIADNSGDYETWEYTSTKSWVEKREFGRIEDGVRRSTWEYTIICYGTKTIAKV